MSAPPPAKQRCASTWATSLVERARRHDSGSGPCMYAPPTDRRKSSRASRTRPRLAPRRARAPINLFNSHRRDDIIATSPTVSELAECCENVGSREPERTVRTESRHASGCCPVSSAENIVSYESESDYRDHWDRSEWVEWVCWARGDQSRNNPYRTALRWVL